MDAATKKKRKRRPRKFPYSEVTPSNPPTRSEREVCYDEVGVFERRGEEPGPEISFTRSRSEEGNYFLFLAHYGEEPRAFSSRKGVARTVCAASIQQGERKIAHRPWIRGKGVFKRRTCRLRKSRENVISLTKGKKEIPFPRPRPKPDGDSPSAKERTGRALNTINGRMLETSLSRAVSPRRKRSGTSPPLRNGEKRDRRLPPARLASIDGTKGKEKIKSSTVLIGR